MASGIFAAILIGGIYYGPVARVIRIAKEVVRFILKSLFIPQVFYRVTGHSLREVWNYGKSRIRWLIQIVVGRVRAVRRRNRDTSAHFAGDTLKWMRDLCPDREDVVLFPTISFQDCAGLERALRDHPEYRSAKCCLLFRRNLFPGDRSTYKTGMVAQLLPLFSRLTSLATFFTDSDELGAQYRFAFGGDFHTLPIPHTKAKLQRSGFEVPLCLSYIGDARTEKGFHLLPRLVSDCAADWSLRDSVQFAIQANYNVPRGEPACVVAKSQLQEVGPIRVELADHALTAEQYDRLLRRSDIGLLLYLRDNYYARTSGVLVEYLSAGIPVIVPANTWLSAQFARITADYQSDITGSMSVLADKALAMEARQGEIASLEFDAGGVIGGFLGIEVEGGEEGMYSLDARLITLDQSRKRESRKVLLYRSQGFAKGTRVVCLPEGVTRVQLRIPVPGVTSPPLQVRVRLLQATGTPPPVGVVGLAYDHESEIIRCIREMRRHYDHYKASAVAFASEVNRYHNAPRLIDALVDADWIREARGKR